MESEKQKRDAVCPGKSLDFQAACEKLASNDAPEYWRSLEELAGSKEFQEQLHREFPKGASEWLDPVSRRGFLKLMGASMALAGLTSCVKQPLEPIVPYVRQPEEIIPGRPLFFATAMTLGGYGLPLLVESQMGRPTKAEGNPDHPASMGATDVFAQASILDLYDPDRSPAVTYAGEIRPYTSFLGAMQGPLAAQRAVQGAGLRFLTRTISSPTQADQLHTVLRLFPAAKWHQYEPLNRDNPRAGAMMAFNQPIETQCRFAEADVILSLDADFLSSGFPGFTRYARDFASRRRPESLRQMSRLYMVESTTSSTGAKADHRLPMRNAEIAQFVRAVATALGINAGGSGPVDSQSKFVAAVVKDLQQHRGSSLVIAGDQQPPLIHALAHAMNQALGNVGKTVVHTDPVAANSVDQSQSLKELIGDMNAGQVDFLVVLGGNPVYDAPADLNFADVFKAKVPLRVHLGLYQDETAALSHWHINETHYLEAWDDTRAYDGSVSIVQPLIAPLYGGKSAHELLAFFAGQPEISGYDLVRAFWQRQHAGGAQQSSPQKSESKPGAATSATASNEFEAFWRRSVHDGFISGTAFPIKQFQLRSPNFPDGPSSDSESLELNFRPDPSIYDGRFANNAWLQELPKPMTKVTWDNPLLIAPKTAERIGLKVNDVVELDVSGKTATGAVWIQAGQPENVITSFLGYGRQRSGRAGTGSGFDMYKARASAGLYSAPVRIRKTGAQYLLASTQGQQSMDTPLGTRDLVVAGTLDEYKKDPHLASEHGSTPPRDLTLYPNYQYKDYAWGLAIDLNACVGCNTCIIACQSENNIAVVGKEQVNRGRHMHWLRVDTYYQGDRENPKAYFQPVPCMHCENAPCEYVCPVGATVHSTEGLNDMVYNRCVGTRYCSNNCPYKVRRFNFLLFQDWNTPQLKMMRNPDVTVRSRGVMEKCTYCVQRINESRIDAERENRSIREAELQTACQQACPADAIVFGNINDPTTRVARLKAEARNYGLLADLNTRPRTSYLAAVNNSNPELSPAPEQK
jgi:MoCo/4Fe-4S cofactor protein with predicted Tat translocation signal